ncbi:MAG: LysR family transcriptional regulator [Gammaproteobacteria bacterium]|nr:LysR family transcriptional regulator [Gammaproteobacteria bacterium]MDX2458953.1 LysR family transcriptional regulator [Gammaproteobacteria bacterium]
MSKETYDPMDMKALRCFEAMAKHESLTQAGIELGISDAAVSQRIKSLEKYLGVKLYEARGGKIRLTEAGHHTKQLATRIFDELAEFTDEICGEEFGGTIVLSAESPLLRYQLPKIVESFKQENRLAQLRLVSRRPSATIELVRRNEADLGIVHKRSMPPELMFFPWREFKAYVLIPRGHPLVRRKVPTVQDILTEETLSRYPQVVAEIDNQEQLRVKDTLERLGLPFNVSLEVGNFDTVKYYVAHGHGIAAVPGMCISSEDESIFHIIEIPEEFEAETTYGVILREDKYISSALQSLLTLLEVPNQPR